MFGTAIFEHMPESFLTDPAAWDVFVGQIWQAVLYPLQLPATATVIEIAPGSSPKIGHALATLGFCGDLHVVEASPPALEQVAAHYRRLLPAATLHLHGSPLDQCLHALPTQADALIGNHIIDDMLLAASATARDTFSWATQYSNTVAPQTHSAFAEFSQQQTQAVAQVAAELTHAVVVVQPRHVVLSQYPSSTLHDSGLGALNTAASGVLAQLRTDLSASYTATDCTGALGTLPHYHNAHIGLNVLNPVHWLSCTRKI